jgi:hypothetical protein
VPTPRASLERLVGRENQTRLRAKKNRESFVTYDLSRGFSTGAIVLASVMFVSVRPLIGVAATLEQVAHCRGLEKAAQRVSCFESLKQGTKANAAGSPKAETEGSVSIKSSGQSTVRRQGALPNGNNVGGTKTTPSAAAKPLQVMPRENETTAPPREVTPGQGERVPPATIEGAATTGRAKATLAKIKQSSRAKLNPAAPQAGTPPEQQALPKQVPEQGGLMERRHPNQAKIPEDAPSTMDAAQSMRPALPTKADHAAPAPENAAAPLKQTEPRRTVLRPSTEPSSANANQALPAARDVAAPVSPSHAEPPGIDAAVSTEASRAASTKPDRTLPKKERAAPPAPLPNAAADQPVPAQSGPLQMGAPETRSPDKSQAGSSQIGQDPVPSTGKATSPPPAVVPQTGLQTDGALPLPIERDLPQVEQATTPQPALTPEPNSRSTGHEAPSPATIEDPATSSIDRTHPAGQPLCIDPDALAVMLVAGLLTANPEKATTDGCRLLPEDASLTRLESYPSIFPSMRIVRVKVASPSHPDMTFGFTIETGR